VSISKVNIHTVDLDERLDEAGFRHVATAVGPRLGAARMGAGVYEAEAGVPIWPYHYHHGVEELLYVIAGAPVLREPARARKLAPGDLVCYPSGPLGAHTLTGPGRFVIFSTGHEREPWMSVYPDSDKVSGPEGLLLRSSAVGYWHGEGTAGPSEPVEPSRRHSWPVPLLERTLVGLGSGEASEPYHYVYGREEWLLVLAGTPTLRHRDGEDELAAGDVVCFPEGPHGAHELRNSSGSAVRALVLSTAGLPANTCYPDTGEWLLRNGPGVEIRTRS
jgi:uncharacterized cupin superfamily protein